MEPHVLGGGGPRFEDSMKIFAVVTWFDPTPDYVKNLFTYRSEVEGLIVVDDSGRNNEHLLGKDPRIFYIWSTDNLGIAHALNVGCKKAAQLGAEWVLTMDQDSAWDDDQLTEYLRRSAQMAIDPAVAIIAPNFHGTGLDPSIDVEECDGVISAGSLVRLSHFSLVGGYNEALFIDQVDFEFGYRLKRHGLRLVRLNGIKLRHAVGERREVRILGRKIASDFHSASRKYYMTRNGLYMHKHFKDFPGPHIERIALLVLGVIALENDKVNKLRHIAKGVLHHWKGIMGRIN